MLTLALLAPAAAPLIVRGPALNKTGSVFSFAGDLWTVSRDGGAARRLTTSPGVESNPQFSPDCTRIAFTGEYDDKVSFLSDRNGPVTLFSYDPKSKKVAQSLANTGLDLKSASATDDAIAYEQFAGLFPYDLKSGKSKPTPVTVAGDFPEVRDRLVKVGDRLSNAPISPTGARAVFEARGEIITVPAEKGDARNLTNTTAAMERDPAWSPDGKSVAYFSDEAGEYMLHIHNQNGMGDVVKIALGDAPGLYFSPRWSPDGKKIAYTDSHQVQCNLDQKKPVRIDKDPYYRPGNITPAWSPDSKWLAYARRLKNFFGAVFVYSVADGKSTQVTNGMSDARDPVWDADGKYLYFTASTDAGGSLQPGHSLLLAPELAQHISRRARQDPAIPVLAGERRGEGRGGEETQGAEAGCGERGSREEGGPREDRL